MIFYSNYYYIKCTKIDIIFKL